MTETSKLKKYLMWYKVNELISKGYKDSQISTLTDLHRQTVAKYRKMSEAEFLSSQAYDRQYPLKLDAFESFVVDELRRCSTLSAPQIHDHLKESFPDTLPDVSVRTVFNFVEHIRDEYGLPKGEEDFPRQYEMQEETAYGEYAQADFGERWMKDSSEKSVKVYFFVLSLSRSRYKYVFFSRRPFTTAMAVYAHEKAFEYFGGIPAKIVYDQDKVLLCRENLGDLVLTHGFQTLVRECRFSPVFCRKADPESKGKVENVVKYVKNSFLRGRVFTGIETLNVQALGWLERTGNGLVHQGTRRVPADEFNTEREHLSPYTGVPTAPREEMPTYHVRKDNVINYHGNYYTVPTGTYKGRGSVVYVLERDGVLTLFSADTGKTVATHKVSVEKGKLVRDRSHRRDREASIDEYEASTMALLPDDPVISAYLKTLRKDRQRHYRDNLKCIRRAAPRYTPDTLVEAFRGCMENRVYNALSLMEVAESIRTLKGEAVPEEHVEIEAVRIPPEIGLTPQKTDIRDFDSLFS